MRISDWSSDVCSSDLHVLRDARTSRFLAIATLNIGAETAGTQGDWLARFRIGAKLDRPGVGDAAVLSAAVLCEFAGELAFGIIGTGDERAELAAAQRKPAAAARRTRARIAAVPLVGKKRRTKKFVDRLRPFLRHLLHASHRFRL